MIRLFPFILFFLTSSSFANLNFSKDYSLKKVDVDELSVKITDQFFSDSTWPEQISIDSRAYAIEYSIIADLKKFVKKELRRYGSDFASVVVMDNNTGNILSAIDYTRSTKSFGKKLTFSATNPAASVFKVITAADLMENGNVESEDEFIYNGKATTLYRYQLEEKRNRWTRKTNLKRAFARSNNVVFGKAAQAYSNFNSLTQMARKFRFSKEMVQFLDTGYSKLFSKDTPYGLAEFASGFNKKTLISPIHGAVIASIIANDGIFRKPSVVKKVTNTDHNLLIWEPDHEENRVLSEHSAKSMQEFMELTVSKGTARGAFRKGRRQFLKDLRIGGKTGSITGGLPYGKRDWFVSYAMPKNGDDKGISICVMIVNVKKWYIKAPALAKNIIEYYYSRVQKIGKL